MAPTAHIFLDKEIEEMIEDLARFISTHKKDGEAFLKEVQGFVSQGKFDQIASKFVSESNLLITIPSKDIEGAYNILVSFLVQKKLESSIPALLGPFLADQLSGKVSLYLNLLSNIYSQLEASSPVRYDVYTTILKFAAKHHRVQNLLGNLEGLEGWTTEWKVDEKKKRELFLLIREILLANNQPIKAHEFLLKYLTTFEGASDAELTPIKEHAVKAAAEAIDLPANFQFDQILDLKAVASLKAEPIYRLLSIFVHGNLKEFNAFSEADKKAVEALGLSHERNLKKFRLLSLASLAAEQPNPLSYQIIAESLSVPESEVEMWVIDAIRFKLIEAKIDQLAKQVSISKTSYRVFGEAQWKQLQQKLGAWKSSVTEVLQVVQNAKIVASQNVAVSH